MKKILLYFLGIVAMSMISPTFVHAEEDENPPKTTNWSTEEGPKLPTYSGGDGSQGSPYLISNLEDLNSIFYTPEHWVTGKYFKQTADIVLPSALERKEGEKANFSPIGTGNSSFSANYNGAGFSISGLTIQAPTESDGTLPDYSYTTLDTPSFGLFTNTSDATITGVILKDVEILLKTNEESNVCIGGLVGKDLGATKIINCSVQGYISGYDCVGGIIGNGDLGGVNTATGSVVSGCAVYLNNLSGRNQVGGIAGLARNISIANSVAIADGDSENSISMQLSGEQYMGGLVGNAINATIEYCYSINEIKTINPTNGLTLGNIGSFIGAATGGTIYHSYALTQEGISSDEIYHHFIGTNNSVSLTACFDNCADEVTLSNGLISMSSTDMAQPDQFIYYGWDFKDKWRIGIGGYPTLCNDNDGVELPRLPANYSELPFVWKGTSEGSCSWSTNSAWTGGAVPTIASKVYIPATEFTTNSATSCVINTSSAECANLVVASSGDLTLKYHISGSEVEAGQLYVDGSSLGNVTYQVHMTTTPKESQHPAIGSDWYNWHYISSPVKGQVIKSFLTNEDNNIPVDNYGQYALGILDQDHEQDLYVQFPMLSPHFDSPQYDQLVLDGSEQFEPGIGYSLKRDETGYVTFTGELNDGDVTVTSYSLTESTDLPNRWAYFGNPYAFALKGKEFYYTIAEHLSEVASAIYMWNDVEQRFDAYNRNTSEEDFLLAPCQAFHVRVQAGSPEFIFKKGSAADVNTRTSTTFKTVEEDRHYVDLKLESGSVISSCSVFFNEATTDGLDIGWDAAVYGTPNKDSFLLATQLIQPQYEEDPLSYQIQTLAETEMTSSSVPMVVQPGGATELTLSLKTLSLPNDVLVYVRDNEVGAEFELTEEKSYTFSVTNQDLSDRFTLEFKSITGIDDQLFDESIGIVSQPAFNNLLVTGVTNTNSTITVYSVTGQVISSKTLSSVSSQNVALSTGMPKGIYIVKIQSGNQVYTEKIKW